MRKSLATISLISLTFCALLHPCHGTAEFLSINPGIDAFRTSPGDQIFLPDFQGNPIPADFFDPGSDAFGAPVCLRGGPPVLTNPPLTDFGASSETDTIIERLNFCTFNAFPDFCSVGVEMRAISLVSVEPITVAYNGGQNPELWDIRVCLSDLPQPPGGTMDINRDDPNSGVFFSFIQVLPKFIFVRQSDSAIREIDFGQDARPPLNYVQVQGVWDINPPYTIPAATLLVDPECDGTPDVGPLPASSNFNPEAPNCNAGTIDPWQTAPGDQTDYNEFATSPLLADFFDPGSDPFDGNICLEGGAPLQFNLPTFLGPTPPDTIIERLGPCFLGDVGDSCTVDVQVVALSLQSCSPITVTSNGGQNPELWDVRACLSSIQPQSPGQMTVRKCNPNGGDFNSTLPVTPKLIFIRQSDSAIRVLDPAPHSDIPLFRGWWDDQAPTCFLPGSFVDHDCDGNPDAGPLPGSCNFTPHQSPPNDCDGNGQDDSCDILDGPVEDCNANGIPDECDITNDPGIDCDGNGIPDECEIVGNPDLDIDRNGILDKCEVNSSIYQLTFTDEAGAPLFSDTDFGALEVDVVTPPLDRVRWVNMLFNGRWAVENGPIINIEGEGARNSYIFQFSLGNSVGPISTANVSLCVSEEPFTDVAQFPPAQAHNVTGDTVYRGNTEDEQNPDDPFNPGVAEDFVANVTPGQTWETVRRRGIPGVSEEVNHCVPGAAARSLAWMNDLYCLGFPANCDGVRELYDKLKNSEHMMTSPTGGTTIRTGNNRNKALDGIEKLIDDKNLDKEITVSWEKFFDDPPTSEDMLNELRQGKDVILFLRWGNSGGNRLKGHAITVTGFIKCATGVSIYYRDDALGGDSQGDSTADSKTKCAGIKEGATPSSWGLTGIASNVNEGYISICVPPLCTSKAIEKTLGMAGPVLDGASASMTIPDATTRLQIKEWACDTLDLACYLYQQFVLSSAAQPCIDDATLLKQAWPFVSRSMRSNCASRPTRSPFKG